MNKFHSYGLNHTCYGSTFNTSGAWKCIVCDRVYTSTNQKWPNCYFIEQKPYEDCNTKLVNR